MLHLPPERSEARHDVRAASALRRRRLHGLPRAARRGLLAAAHAKLPRPVLPMPHDIPRAIHSCQSPPRRHADRLLIVSPATRVRAKRPAPDLRARVVLELPHQHGLAHQSVRAARTVRERSVHLMPRASRIPVRSAAQEPAAEPVLHVPSAARRGDEQAEPSPGRVLPLPHGARVVESGAARGARRQVVLLRVPSVSGEDVLEVRSRSDWRARSATAPTAPDTALCSSSLVPRCA